MDAREAYQRRAWRLALLLTDSDAHASRVLHDVTRLHPAPERGSDARYDRTVIQSARPTYESPVQPAQDEPHADGLSTRVKLSDAAARVWEASRDLEPQPREAWVLTALDGLDLPRAARAMDCSRNAIEAIHLPTARRALESKLGPSFEAAERELVDALDKLDPTEAVRELEVLQAEQQKRSRIVTVASLCALFLAFGVLLYVIVDLMRWQEENAPVRIESTLSNPMPEAQGDTGADPDPQQDAAP